MCNSTAIIFTFINSLTFSSSAFRINQAKDFRKHRLMFALAVSQLTCKHRIAIVAPFLLLLFWSLLSQCFVDKLWQFSPLSVSCPQRISLLCSYEANVKNNIIKIAAICFQNSDTQETQSLWHQLSDLIQPSVRK
jgi:hypothetical protein